MTRITGGCLCGAVRYESGGPALMALRCHCRDCQYLSGGEPADALVVPSASLRRVKGEDRFYWTHADSGTRVFRSFCAQCGTPLFAGNTAHPEAIASSATRPKGSFERERMQTTSCSRKTAPMRSRGTWPSSVACDATTFSCSV